MQPICLSSDIELRLISLEDHGSHLALMHRIYPAAYVYLWPDGGAWYIDRVHSKEAFEKDLVRKNTPYYHVYFRGKLVGIYRLKLHAEMPDFPAEPALKLDRLYLDDTVRGKGVGTMLVNYAAAETLRLGKSLLWLERMDTNGATIAFYRKCGFTDGSTFRLPFELMYPEYRGMCRLWWRP